MGFRLFIFGFSSLPTALCLFRTLECLSGLVGVSKLIQFEPKHFLHFTAYLILRFHTGAPQVSIPGDRNLIGLSSVVLENVSLSTSVGPEQYGPI